MNSIMNLSPVELAAYKFVEQMLPKVDGHNGIYPYWYGWVIREAFEAGFEFAAINPPNKPVEPTGQPSQTKQSPQPDGSLS